MLQHFSSTVERRKSRMAESSQKEKRRREYVVLSWHGLIHETPVCSQQKCAICGAQIVRVRAATQCQGCLEGCTVNGKTLLDYGRGEAVTTPEDGS